jgi:hypothetical protein
MDNETNDGIGELIRSVRQGQETIFDLIGENGASVRRIEVSQRKLQPELPVQMPEPDVARALARAHVFNDVEAFSAYLNRNGSKDASIILADVEEQTIVAVLNEDEMTDREQIVLQAVEHPLFSPWAKMLGTPIGVVDFALFIMQHRRAVDKPDGRELAMIFSQVKMSKQVTVATGVGKKSLNGVMVDVEIAGEKKGVAVELPESIQISAPLFVGTSPQVIEIDLLVTNMGERVVVYCTATDVESARIAAFEEMIDSIKEQTGQLVGLGQVKHRSWSTVPFASR